MPAYSDTFFMIMRWGDFNRWGRGRWVECGIWALNRGGLVQMGVFNLLCFAVFGVLYTFVAKL